MAIDILLYFINFYCTWLRQHIVTESLKTGTCVSLRITLIMYFLIR